MVAERLPAEMVAVVKREVAAVTMEVAVEGVACVFLEENKAWRQLL